MRVRTAQKKLLDYCERHLSFPTPAAAAMFLGLDERAAELVFSKLEDDGLASRKNGAWTPTDLFFSNNKSEARDAMLLLRNGKNVFSGSAALCSSMGLGRGRAVAVIAEREWPEVSAREGDVLVLCIDDCLSGRYAKVSVDGSITIPATKENGVLSVAGVLRIHSPNIQKRCST